MTDDLWSHAEREQLAADSRQPYPGRWSYTWLGGNVEPIMQPLSRVDVEDEDGRIDPLKWGDAVIEMRSRPKIVVAPSPLHRHEPACFEGQPEMISLKVQPPDHVGIVDAMTGHWITQRLATSEESRDTRVGLDVNGPGPGPRALPVYR